MQLGELLEKLNKADFIVSNEALKLLKSLDDCAGLADKLLAGDSFIISKEAVEKAIGKPDEEKIPVPVEVHRAPDFKPIAKECEASVSFIGNYDVSGRSKCKGTVEDFVAYFRDRMKESRKLLRARGSPAAVSKMSGLKGYARGTEVRIIGMVADKRITKKGHMLIELEDEESAAKVIVLNAKDGPGKACWDKAGSVLLDEVVAVDGRVSDPFVMASDIIWPDIPLRQPATAESDMCIAFMSDLHVGSRHFLQKEFGNMLRWLNGDLDGSDGRELAGRVKYVVIAGDIADGIGVYPKQEKDLVVRDIYEQYRMAGKLIDQIPDYIEVVIIPGNHDAVRRSEPQPRLPPDFFACQRQGVHFAGSPSMVSLEGIKVLAYHGTSLDSIIAALPGLDYQHPESSMTELLKRRHLSPLYGDNPIVPEERDYMVMGELPDILHMGHIHKNGYATYRGTTIINSGTWQAQTDYQVRQGHVPSPCIMPVYELRTGKMNFMNFAGA
ncbi:MAG: DNA-directed DNA polymerase II small subunit [Candidatus Micrarchaeota archaeon]|nr:DNA-directed DNA polymerase II small subunit [Candidatus Micrarchaeota archaeon]